jgi:small subunit ribosomal protein S8
MTDPIADLLTRIRNGAAARHANTVVPYSSIKENILKIMKSKQYIADFTVNKEEREIVVMFNENSAKASFKRVSKPGQRIYKKYEELRKVNNGFGISIVSTPKGMMTGSNARKNKLGGEVICEIF